MLFPLPKLMLCIAKDEKSSRKTLQKIKPLLEKMRDNEYVKRTMISDLGVKSTERINLKSGSKKQQEEDEYECETCSANLYVSFVSKKFAVILGGSWKVCKSVLAKQRVIQLLRKQNFHLFDHLPTPCKQS